MANTKQTAFRLPEELVDDLDKYAAQMERENPGMSFSRADAVRVLLTRGLAGAGLVRDGGSSAREVSRAAPTKRAAKKKARSARARKE